MGRRLIVIGACAGGVEARRAVVAGLPPALAAAVVVVPRGAPSALPGILSEETVGQHFRTLDPGCPSNGWRR